MRWAAFPLPEKLLLSRNMLFLRRTASCAQARSRRHPCQGLDAMPIFWRCCRGGAPVVILRLSGAVALARFFSGLRPLALSARSVPGARTACSPRRNGNSCDRGRSMDRSIELQNPLPADWGSNAPGRAAGLADAAGRLCAGRRARPVYRILTLPSDALHIPLSSLYYLPLR